MSRTRKTRSIQRAPSYQGLKPYGVQVKSNVEVELHLEEYEAIKLCDFDLLTQAEAADVMEVSRPTFTRIYESARRKMARVLVEPCVMKIRGGHAMARTVWHQCLVCQVSFAAEPVNAVCPLCGTGRI